MHVTIPPDLSQVVPAGHVSQLAASAAVAPNANNDIEVTNNNEGTRNIGVSVDRWEAGIVSCPKNTMLADH